MKTLLPTYSMEIERRDGSRFTDWGTFTKDADAIYSAMTRKLAKGLRVIHVARAGSIIWKS